MCGFVGIFLNQLTFTYAVDYTAAANVALILASAPAFAAVFAVMLGHERVRPAHWMALRGVAHRRGARRRRRVEPRGLQPARRPPGRRRGAHVGGLHGDAAAALRALLGGPDQRARDPRRRGHHGARDRGSGGQPGLRLADPPGLGRMGLLDDRPAPRHELALLPLASPGGRRPGDALHVPPALPGRGVRRVAPGREARGGAADRRAGDRRRRRARAGGGGAACAGRRDRAARERRFEPERGHRDGRPRVGPARRRRVRRAARRTSSFSVSSASSGASGSRRRSSRTPSPSATSCRGRHRRSLRSTARAASPAGPARSSAAPGSSCPAWPSSSGSRRSSSRAPRRSGRARSAPGEARPSPRSRSGPGSTSCGRRGWRPRRRGGAVGRLRLRGRAGRRPRRAVARASSSSDAASSSSPSAVGATSPARWRCSRRRPSAGGWAALAWTAFKVGGLSYGGGFVIIPLMQADAVSHYHWMTSAQFLEAVALGQITPGPVVQTVAVVGYAAFGRRGRARRGSDRVQHRRSSSCSSDGGGSTGSARTSRAGVPRRAPGAGRRDRSDPRRRRPARGRAERAVAVRRPGGGRGRASRFAAERHPRPARGCCRLGSS